jgi:selenocysteine-specific elongation factor
VRDEIAILLAGTTLEGAPICEVSSHTGEGIELLRATIQQRAPGAVRPEPAGCFRLPIDRAFIMRGHGLVVTGTATAGRVETEATVRILPGGQMARVRAIQVHGEPVASGQYGQRLALNLSGVERADVARGHVVCAADLDRTTERFDARVELRPAARRPLAGHSAVRVYVGTAEALATIVWLDGRAALPPQEQTYAQLLLREPIVAFGGDRFVLRDQNARRTIGGGVVLHPFAARSQRRPDPRLDALMAIDQAPSAATRLDALLGLEAAFAVAPERLAATANLTTDVVRAALAQQPGILALPQLDRPEAYTTTGKWSRLRAAVERALTEFHAANPRQPGMEMESLRSQLAPDVPAKVFRAVVTRLERDAVLVRDDSLLRLPTHRIGLEAGEQTLARGIVERLEAGGYTPPDMAELSAALHVPRARLVDVLNQLERDRTVVRASSELWFGAQAIEAARALVRQHFESHGELDAATFRDLIGASRKFSIALLTYFDRIGFTLRVGDVRKLRRR